MPTEDQFWAVMTHQRDEGLAHLTAIIERSGMDEFCDFLAKHVLPQAADVPEGADLVAHVIAHMAIVGAVDAMLAFRDAH